jgi:hypothetical protein
VKEEKVRKYKFTLEYECFGSEDDWERIASELYRILSVRLHSEGRLKVAPW